MNDASYDILFVTSDKTEGGIQRALCDWASVCLSASNLQQASLNHTSLNHTSFNHTGLKFAGLTPQNRFSHWLAAHQADTHIHPLTSPLRVMMRYTPSLFPHFSDIKSAKLAFVHNGFACAAARKIASHVIGVCHNDKPHHFAAADRLICLTPSAIHKALQAGWSEDRLFLLPHFHECQHQQMALPAPSAHFRISAAGRFVQKKNFSFFIELAAEIHATRPDIQFTLGGDGPLMTELRTQARETRAEVTFSGWMNMDRLIQQTDLFLLPSTDEPFGYVLSEMMDAGTAVISSPTSGADYMLDGGSIAPVIPLNDIQKWKNTILELADNPSAHQALRKRCYNRIRQAQFSKAHFAQQLNSLITDTLR